MLMLKSAMQRSPTSNDNDVEGAVCGFTSGMTVTAASLFLRRRDQLPAP